MKSAFERAMERTGGGGVSSLSAAQKAELADVHSLYEAKIAQVRLAAEAEGRRCADDPEKAAVVRRRMAGEIAELEEQREAKKNALRKGFGA